METSVTIKSGRYNLSGVLHVPAKGKAPYPSVVMFHGLGGNKAESHFIFTKIARFLAGKGIAVLRFDFMGSGDSEGKFESMTPRTEMNDGRRILEFIIRDGRFSNDRIGVLGLSMGAVTASFVASEYGTRSLVLWSPLAYPKILEKRALTRKLRRELAEKGRVYLLGAGQYVNRKFFDSLDNVCPLDYAKSYRGNVLIVHAKDDATLPLEHSFAYFESFHGSAVLPRIIVLEDGGHTFTTEFSETTVIEETAEFFAETLF